MSRGHCTKGHHVRAAALHYSLLRSFARGFTRMICCCLVLLACLAQLWMSAQYRHTPGFAAHAMVSRAAAEASSLTLGSIDAGQPGVPCALHGAHASSHQGTALRLATTAIARAAHSVPAAQPCTPRWAFCRRRWR